MVYATIEHLDLIADANFHGNYYEPTEHFASCALWREVGKHQLVAAS